MFEISKEFQLEAVASGRPEWIIPTPAPLCNLAIRKDTGEWFVATGVFYKTLESIDGTLFRDSDGCTWRLLRTDFSPAKPTNLIAAAPDLLSALKQIVFDWDGEPEDMIEARAAIAKAEGRHA